MLNRDQVLKLLRKRLGKRYQSELAEELGISKVYLGDILKGKRDPGDAVLSKLGLERIVMYIPKVPKP